MVIHKSPKTVLRGNRSFSSAMKTSETGDCMTYPQTTLTYYLQLSKRSRKCSQELLWERWILFGGHNHLCSTVLSDEFQKELQDDSVSDSLRRNVLSNHKINKTAALPSTVCLTVSFFLTPTSAANTQNPAARLCQLIALSPDIQLDFHSLI